MNFKEYANSKLPSWTWKSQNGEDRIIKCIFEEIPPATYSCVEFGAADGVFCSNTNYLWATQGWTATLAESDTTLYDRLVKNSKRDKVTCLNVEVQSVDDLVDEEVDLVSIDVDGLDYDIWDATTLRHRVVVVEHNPTFPPHVEYHGGLWQGSAAASLLRLARDKDYTLVACTKTNMIFVRNEDANFLDQYDTTLENNFDRSGLSYVVSDYHGNFDIAGDVPYGMVHRTRIGFYHE